MSSDMLKRRLREMKRTEQKFRCIGNGEKSSSLVWDLFFDLRETGCSKAKYSLKLLLAMDREALSHVINEYWSFVYEKLFPDSDHPGVMQLDPGALLRWGLSANADEAAVKKRFRELAKQYHPDTGGDEKSFIALMEAYHTLTGK